MANQIRLKRASGSDPTASDLVLGEPAVRTDTGELFFLKDNGNVAKVSGGGISDGDKGDITISNSGDTFTIDSGVIDNANIASNAAIAGSKISPDFGSQTVASGQLNITSTLPRLRLIDSNNNPSYSLRNNNGTFEVYDDLAPNARFSIDDSKIVSKLNHDFNAGIDVTGDIISTAHITGVSDSSQAAFIAKGDDSSQDGYIQLNCSQNSHGIKLKSPAHSAGQSYTLTFPSSIVNNGALLTDTNGNLSTSLIGTSNISNNAVSLAKLADISQNQIIGRLSSGSGDPEALNPSQIRSIINVENGATADQTASEILTLIKTVDGSGSGLDADTLDGVQASGLVAVGGDTMTGNLRVDINSNADGIVGEVYTNYFGLKHADQTANSEYMILSQDTHTFISASSGSNVYIRYGGNDSTNQLVVGSGNDALTWRGNKIFHAGNDGSGSGLDADTLDGVSSGEFLRSNAADTANSDITFNGGAGAATVAGNSDIRFNNGSWTGNTGSVGKIQMHSNYLYIVGGTGGIIFREDGTNRWQIDGSGHFDPAADSTYDIGSSGVRVRNGYFDTLYGDGSNLTNLPSQTDQNFTTTLKNKLDNIAAGATNVTNNNQLTNGAGYITSAALAGASDGGNAALLDGIDSTQFVRADQNDTLSGVITFSSISRDCINLSGASSDDHRGIAFNGRIGLSADQNDGWLRLNQASEFTNGTYTPSLIRADGGFFVDGTSKGINGSGNFVNGTIAGASDVSVSAGNNTIVRRHSSGYIFSNFINTTDNSVSSGVTAVMVKTGSDYHRSGTAAAVRAFLNVEDGATAAAFPSGTRMIFQQTSAPTGWTKDTSDTNQRALRVVSGTASSGGSVDFTSAFVSQGVSGSIANTTQGGSIANGGNNTNSGGNNTNNATSGGNVNNHTLSTGRMPSHRHDGGAKGIHDAANGQYGTNARGNTRYPLVRFDALNGYANYDTYWTSNAGSTQAHSHSFSGSAHSHSINNHSHTINAHSHSFSGSAHNHSFSGTAINLAVRYLDVIIAQKD